jgi:hypothetical protein
MSHCYTVASTVVLNTQLSRDKMARSCRPSSLRLVVSTLSSLSLILRVNALHSGNQGCHIRPGHDTTIEDTIGAIRDDGKGTKKVKGRKCRLDMEDFDFESCRVGQASDGSYSQNNMLKNKAVMDI